MLEQAPAAVQVTAIVEEMEEALPVEEEAVAELAVSEPIPTTTPQTGALTAEPALGEAVQLGSEAEPGAADEARAAEKAGIAATAAPEEEQAQAMAVEPPRAGDSDAMAAKEAVEAPAALPLEATSLLEGAGAAEVGEAATAIVEFPPTEPPPVVVPTTVVQATAPAPMAREAPAMKPAGVLQQPSTYPLRLVEIGLAILVVFLGTLAILATILQRRLR